MSKKPAQSESLPVKIPETPKALLPLETETRKPQMIGCSRDGIQRQLAISVLCEADWISAWKSCPLSINVIAYMHGVFSLPSRDDEESREWKPILLLLSDDGDVYSIGSVYAIKSWMNAVRKNDGAMSGDIPVSIRKVDLDNGNTMMRLSVTGKGLFKTRKEIPSTQPESPKIHNEGPATEEEMPF